MQSKINNFQIIALIKLVRNLVNERMYFKNFDLMEILVCFLGIIIPIVSGKLKLCSEPVDEIQLCKQKNDYRANDPPRILSYTDPKPAILTPILNLQNVLDVDHDKKSMTIYFTIEMHWNESRIGISTPDDLK